MPARSVPSRYLPARSNATTVLSAGTMALSAYGYSALFNATGEQHRMLFLTAALILVLALAADLLRARAEPPRPGD
ncbi:hypothetical protein [Bordetella genomosp. 13]|uniref:hypothetical protein n=1 Tax=Bordetella genomosp. 13 TaxID=463040 RepID=UPI0011A82718|nr:hypothetical protein [Bordetella genomosp. 13]